MAMNYSWIEKFFWYFEKHSGKLIKQISSSVCTSWTVLYYIRLNKYFSENFEHEIFTFNWIWKYLKNIVEDLKPPKRRILENGRVVIFVTKILKWKILLSACNAFPTTFSKLWKIFLIQQQARSSPLNFSEKYSFNLDGRAFSQNMVSPKNDFEIIDMNCLMRSGEDIFSVLFLRWREQVISKLTHVTTVAPTQVCEEEKRSKIVI